ncbi:MAG: PaaI family thioesterase [Hyphomonadaceae bacterium]
MSIEGGGGDLSGKPHVETHGPFAGWLTWGTGGDPYETLTGPYYFRIEDGQARCAFQPRPEHLNGSGAIHGGALMTFADFSLFAIAHNALQGGVRAVTLTCNCEFIRPGGLDGLVEAHGEVLSAGRSMIFVRGLMTQRAKPVLAFSGSLKKIAA